VNLGASMGTVKTDFTHAPTTLVINGDSGSSKGFTESDTSSPDGFIGGGQIGYNWQYSPLIVVGLEADFQGAAERNHNTLTDPFSHLSPGGGFLISGTTVTDYSTQIDWFGTVRARIGYVWGNGQVLTYATGGLAYGEVKINGTGTDSGSVCGQKAGACTTPSTPFSISHAIGHSDVNIGWTAGYGTEGRLGNTNWTWKVENLYMDLGHLNDTDLIVGPKVSASGAQVTSNAHFTDWILRGGLNYKFY
jgi:outer membrane immunogenic protein